MALRHDADSLYFDFNASTPLHPAVVEAMLPYLTEHFGNPSSAHVFGRRTLAAVESARAQVAALLGCAPEEILFTSGGTEANNLAIRGAVAGSSRRHILTSAVEHPPVARPCDWLERQGFDVTRLPVDGQGRVDPEEARAFLRGDTALVTVMLAQNETGTLMPVAALAGLARAAGALLHTDAAQAVGKISVVVGELGVDFLSVAGHKLYAPKGVGALYVRRGVPLAPVLLGAGHERGLRPGTENVPSIVGLGRACELAIQHMEAESARQRRLTEKLWVLLSGHIPGLRRNGHVEHRLPNTLNLSFPDVRGSTVLANAPGLAASTGSACHAGTETPSHVLTEMGLTPGQALGAVRLSIGRTTSDEDIGSAAEMLVTAYRGALAR